MFYGPIPLIRELQIHSKLNPKNTSLLGLRHHTRWIPIVLNILDFHENVDCLG